MSVLYLDPVGGIAGDMFLAACLDLGVPQAALESALAKLVPIRLEVTRDPEALLSGLHVEVVAADDKTERSYTDVVALVSAAGLSKRVTDSALAVFRAIGEAEAHVHRKPLESLHFHEVGALDSIADVVGACLCLEALGWPKILASPPPSGSGTTNSMHGVIPIPAPATLELMKGRRMRPSGPGERTTPTGAALLKVLTEEADSMPDLVVEKIGYGVGTKRFPDAPNVLRAVLGREAEGHRGATCTLFEANLDDATGQLLARAVEAALEAGALDAWVTPIVGKKGRPGHLLSALADPDRAEAVVESLLRETTTLGVRAIAAERRVLDREWQTVETAWGAVRVKLGKLRGEVVNVAPEHDDCLRVAKDSKVPLKLVVQAAVAAFKKPE